MSSEIRPRIEALLSAMSHQLYEKERTIALVLLSALAGESVFLLGPPGVAKSLIARRLKFAFTEAKAFEYLMGKFSTPDEVFGPVSIQKLKDEDKYERLYEQYLPGANIVFLDEIWKASPPIQNALLTVLNERIFRNGAHEIRVDLRALISASNELPLPGEGLDALWDRFLLRLVVNNIEREDNFANLITMGRQQIYADPVPDSLKINRDTYQNWQESLDQVAVPQHVIRMLQQLRQNIHRRNQSAEPADHLYVSDRRWRKIVQLLKTAAFLHDRKEVKVIDAYLVADCIWNQVDQVEETFALVQGSIANHGYQRLVDLRPIEIELEALKQEIDEATHHNYEIEEDIPKTFRDEMGTEFVRILQFWGDGHGYLRVQDYESLSKEKKKNIPVFEQTNNGYRPFQTIGFTLENPLVLLDKAKKREIDSQTITREIRETKVPPIELKRIWENQINLLLEHCERGLMTLESQKMDDEGHLRNHLFVPDEWGSHVLNSLDSTVRDLVNLKLEIQKVRHGYESVAAPDSSTPPKGQTPDT